MTMVTSEMEDLLSARVIARAAAISAIERKSAAFPNARRSQRDLPESCAMAPNVKTVVNPMNVISTNGL